MLDGLHFFDGLERQAAALVKDASNTLDNSKRLRKTLEVVEHDLRNNYRMEDLEDNLDDDLFATHFASGLFEDMTDLETKCKRVTEALSCRKGALDDVLGGI